MIVVSETRTGPVPFTHTYTFSYDHNGNRLTQTVNGQLYQSFTYNGHDVLASGLNESETYDYNGNLLTQILNGQYSSRTYDDEDRMTSITMPDGHTDYYSYNGLGLRLTKSDPSGNYAYFTDGTSPASDVLSDNFSSFTPGISETKGVGNGQYASLFYLADASGNSRGLLNGSQAATDGYNWDAFGTLMSRNGGNPTAFAWGEGSGYQSDADTGLKLLGHRYYDSRVGRFLSQDPAGSGDNWYAYAGNDPVDNTNPTGLVIAGGGMGMFQDPTQAGSTYDPNNDANAQYYDGVPGEYNDYNSKTGAYMGSEWRGATAFDQMNGSSMGPGMGMFAQGGGKLTPSEADRANYLSKKIDNIARDLQKRKGELREDPSKLAERVKGDKAKPSLSRWGHRKIMNELKNTMDRTMNELKSILQKAGVATEGLDDITFDIPIIMIYNPHNVYGGWKPNEGPT